MKTLFMNLKILLVVLITFILFAFNNDKTILEKENIIESLQYNYGYVGDIIILYKLPKSSPAIQALINDFEANATLDLGFAIQILKSSNYVSGVKTNFNPNGISINQHTTLSSEYSQATYKSLRAVHHLIAPGGPLGGNVGIDEYY